MKSIFGKKGSSSSSSNGASHDSAANGDPQPLQLRDSPTKKQSLIESLRSADTETISGISSTTSYNTDSVFMDKDGKSHNSNSNRNAIRTNYQQLNKKVVNAPQPQRRRGIGSSSTDFSALQQQQQQQKLNVISPPIGLTHSLDNATTSSLSTHCGVSVLEPPYMATKKGPTVVTHMASTNSTTLLTSSPAVVQMQRRQQQGHHHHHQKLPPEPNLPTSQQSYRPPPVPQVSSTVTAAGAAAAVATVEAAKLIGSDNFSTSDTATNPTITALTFDRRYRYVDNNDDNDSDGVDQEQLNRLLAMNPIHNSVDQQQNSQSIDRNEQQHPPTDSNDSNDDDDIVPFACFPQRKFVPPNNVRSNAAAYASSHMNTNTTGAEIPTKIPNSNTLYSKFRIYFVKTGLIYVLIVVFTAVSMLYGLSDQLTYAKRHRYHSQEILDIQVAFLGNAYFFVNDVPRLLEAISQGHVYQNSCLHAGGSLSDLWSTGNGMYTLWQTDESIIEYSTAYTSSADDNVNNNDDDDGSTPDDDTSMATTYDYGVCSVLQLLQGYDEYIGYGNKYGKYYSDGLNPCIVDSDYATFIDEQLQKDPVSWDYIVIVEQTKRLTVPEARNETVYSLKYRYGPLIKATGAIPVIVDTHSFWSSKSNMTGLTDIPTFAALIALGVSDLTAALSSVLPSKQAPLVAPIGLAYLTVWEEDYTLWQKLFLDDGIHSSVYGSYLFACVLYATLFDQLPNHDGTNIEFNIPSLFMDARKIVGQATYPTADEAEYLRNVAGRVALRGFVPQSLLDAMVTLEQQNTNSYGNR
jgi:hypothetical protein